MDIEPNNTNINIKINGLSLLKMNVSVCILSHSYLVENVSDYGGKAGSANQYFFVNTQKYSVCGW